MPLYGFFSRTSARDFGTCEYSTPDGKNVVVTEVSSNRNVSLRPDTVFVGEVVKCVRSNTKPDPFDYRSSGPPDEVLREYCSKVGNPTK